MHNVSPLYKNQRNTLTHREWFPGWVKKIKTSATVSTETARWIDIADSQRVKGVTDKAVTTLIQFIYTTYQLVYLIFFKIPDTFKVPGFVVYLMVNTCPKVGLSGVKSSALITGTKISIDVLVSENSPLPFSSTLTLCFLSLKVSPLMT